MNERDELIKRIEERLEFANAIKRFSDVEFFEAMLRYLTIESRQRTREEEIEDFERMISDDYKNMEKIEKSGENYMHSRTNTAFWVWLARAKLDR